MVVLPLAAFGSAAIEVHRQCSYRLGEDPDTGPDRREVQRTFLSDIGPADSIRHCVGRDHMIDRCLEFGCRHVAPLAAPQKRKPLHYRLLLSETNIAKRFVIWIRQCLTRNYFICQSF